MEISMEIENIVWIIKHKKRTKINNSKIMNHKWRKKKQMYDFVLIGCRHRRRNVKASWDVTLSYIYSVLYCLHFSSRYYTNFAFVWIIVFTQAACSTSMLLVHADLPDKERELHAHCSFSWAFLLLLPAMRSRHECQVQHTAAVAWVLLVILLLLRFACVGKWRKKRKIFWMRDLYLPHSRNG